MKMKFIQCVRLPKITSKKRNLFIFFIVLLTSTYILISLFQENYASHISCYDIHLPDGIIDILDDVEEPPKGKSIFFHETSCKNKDNWTLMINSRQACAIESAAIYNPDYMVYVLFTSPIRYPNTSDPGDKNEKFVKRLLSYKNIKIRHVNLKRYTKNTPLEEWYLSGKLQNSHFPVSHASDILRYLSLWKYGGIYLDLDVVVMKEFGPLVPNFAGAESSEDVAAGVIGFDYQNVGHEFAEDCVRDLREHFQGRDWGYNGPGVITRVLKKKCRTKKTTNMTPENCKGFQVMPPFVFYPIPWKRWTLYFDSNQVDNVLNTLRHSYTIHVWNKKSENETIFNNLPPVAYGHIASKHCPNIFQDSGSTF